MGRAAVVVDVAAVGLGVDDVDLGAEAPKSRRRDAEAAPLAQSTTTRSPSRRRPSTEATDGVDVPVEVGVRRWRPPAVPARRSRRTRPEPSTGASSAASNALLDVVGELAPTRGEELDAVVGARGCAMAEIIAPGNPAVGARPRPPRGWAATPSSSDRSASGVRGRRPERASSAGPTPRVSRPTTNG